jgi:hypothetical protein
MLRSLSPLILSFVLVFMVAITVGSCVDHDLSPPVVVNCDGFKTVSYVNDIVPIINTHCAIEGNGACHNGNNGDDIDWRQLTNLQNHATEMQRRVQLAPSDPDHMPRIGQLELRQIQLLVCWAQQGAQNN